MTTTVVIAGSPTALGGHFAGMDRTPAGLRAAGLIAALAQQPALADITWQDAGDAPNDPGWAPDPDPRAKNRAALLEYLPRLAGHVADALRSADASARLFVVGGDCTSHAGAMAGLRRARPGLRLGLAWFDAHCDFNTPDTTPSGNVWGMPFAMATGRGEPDLVAAVDGPTVRAIDSALLGGQVLDEMESRMLAADGVAQFGAGMLGDPAGLAALDGWARAVATRIDAWYVAIDLDVLDEAVGLPVATPEPEGISLDSAVAATRVIAASGAPVLGLGTTAAQLDPARPEATERTVRTIADLAAAALGDPAG